MRRQLKVGLTTLAPFIGGAEVALERLALGLQSLGHTVFVVVGKQGKVLERFQAAGLRCIYTPLYLTDKWHWWKYYKARSILQDIFLQERPDVVHSNDLPTHQAVAEAARRTQVPRVCHHRFPFDGPTIDWLNKYGAERHLFVSQALMDDMCQQSGRLAASTRTVVYDGLPLPVLPTKPARQQARHQLGLAAHKIIVTFAGQLIERKGVADLLQAWALLDNTIQQTAQLVLIGDDLQGQGQYRLAMQQLAHQLQCDVHFVGFQHNVGTWLLASDLAVVPSHVEPLGNATLEAMSYVLPVIGCAVGGIPEMLVHEHTGLLVPPHDPGQLARALARLLVSEDMRTRYGFQARQRCDQLFSIQTHAHNVVQTYHHVLDK